MDYEKPPPYSPQAPLTSQPPYPANNMYQQPAPYMYQQANMPPPPGMPSQPMPGPNYANPAPMVYVQQQVAPTRQQIVLVGGCPACRVGVLEDTFTCAGICCALLFFPFGILCCLAMMKRSCPICGAQFN